MNLVDRPSVHLRFRFSDPMIDRQRVVPHRLRQVQMREQMLDFVKSCVMVVLVVACMRVRVVGLVRMIVFASMQVLMKAVELLRAMDQHLHMRAGNAALDRRLGGNLNARKSEAAHRIQKRLLIVQQLI